MFTIGCRHDQHLFSSLPTLTESSSLLWLASSTSSCLPPVLHSPAYPPSLSFTTSFLLPSVCPFSPLLPQHPLAFPLLSDLPKVLHISVTFTPSYFPYLSSAFTHFPHPSAYPLHKQFPPFLFPLTVPAPPTGPPSEVYKESQGRLTSGRMPFTVNKF